MQLVSHFFELKWMRYDFLKMKWNKRNEMEIKSEIKNQEKRDALDSGSLIELTHQTVHMRASTKHVGQWETPSH